MKILAIETSCDDTGIALVECTGNPLSRSRSANWRIKVLENIVSSQIKIHRPFGGVVPNLAKREHIKNLPLILRKILNPKRYTLNPDLVAVTVGPGLEPALWAGIEFAKDLAKQLKKPLIGVNHLAGHLYSFLLPSKTQNLKAKTSIVFPAIVLLVSGGHTILLKMDSLTKWKKLGETRDDAVGEAFDKVARMLNLPYPGGPEIEKLANKGNPKAINFPRPMLRDKGFDFSFSGLKTAVLYYLRDIVGYSHLPLATRVKSKSLNPTPYTLNPTPADIAASFQQAAVDVLVTKTERAARKYGAQSIILCGGVAANKALRAAMAEAAKKNSLQFLVPDIHFNTDNATMIAAAAYMSVLCKKKLPLKANGNLNI